MGQGTVWPAVSSRPPGGPHERRGSLPPSPGSPAALRRPTRSPWARRPESRQARRCRPSPGWLHSEEDCASQGSLRGMAKAGTLPESTPWFGLFPIPGLLSPPHPLHHELLGNPAWGQGNASPGSSQNHIFGGPWWGGLVSRAR